MRWCIGLLALAAACGAAELPKGMRLLPGPVNGVLVGEKLLIYGDPALKPRKVSHVLFTHARRDVVWAGAPYVKAGAQSIAPETEKALFENPQLFWADYETKRFHDYTQVNTKVLREPVVVSRGVRGGDVLDVDGTRVEVIDTAGYTRGAVSYLVPQGGKRIAFTGDLIYGDGRIFDLYSLQDAMPEAKLRGYHGYAARTGELIRSLRKVRALNADVLIPVRGPIIANPSAAIDRLIARLQQLMSSHFATDALLWYFGPDSLRIRSRDALDGRPVDSMPIAAQRPLPDWVQAFGNSRILLSKTGAAFLVDAGYKPLAAKLEELAGNQMKSLDGIWITHYHDDHTDYAQATAERFRCPVYYTERMQHVLEHPAEYRLPCLSANPITSGRPQLDGARLRWNEFQLTFYFFPGQTLHHGGLLVERDGADPLFFVGDSFTPTGIDDYCMQNRDFLREGEGFLYCLDLMKRLPSNTWLINQHVPPTFQFSGAQMALMRSELSRRLKVLSELTPWPEANYGVDESWAAIRPYGAKVHAGAPFKLETRIFNHSQKPETYRVKWNLPSGWRLVNAQERVTIPARREGVAPATIVAADSGLKVVTADVAFSGGTLREWTESLIRVE